MEAVYNCLYLQNVTGTSTEFTPSDGLPSMPEDLIVVLIGQEDVTVNVAVNNADSVEPTSEVDDQYLFPEPNEPTAVELKEPDNILKMTVVNVKNVTVVNYPDAVVSEESFYYVLVCH